MLTLRNFQSRLPINVGQLNMRRVAAAATRLRSLLSEETASPDPWVRVDPQTGVYVEVSSTGIVAGWNGEAVSRDGVPLPKMAQSGAEALAGLLLELSGEEANIVLTGEWQASDVRFDEASRQLLQSVPGSELATKFSEFVGTGVRFFFRWNSFDALLSVEPLLKDSARGFVQLVLATGTVSWLDTDTLLAAIGLFFDQDLFVRQLLGRS